MTSTFLRLYNKSYPTPSLAYLPLVYGGRKRTCSLSKDGAGGMIERPDSLFDGGLASRSMDTCRVTNYITDDL